MEYMLYHSELKLQPETWRAINNLWTRTYTNGHVNCVRKLIILLHLMCQLRILWPRVKPHCAASAKKSSRPGTCIHTNGTWRDLIWFAFDCEYILTSSLQHFLWNLAACNEPWNRRAMYESSRYTVFLWLYVFISFKIFILACWYDS